MSGRVKPIYPPATGFLNSAEEALWNNMCRKPYIYAGERYLIGKRTDTNEIIFSNSSGDDIVTMGPVYNILYNEYKIRFNQYINSTL